MAVKLLSSSGGSVTLDVGVTASNFALTVPSANGSVVVGSSVVSATGQIPFSTDGSTYTPTAKIVSATAQASTSGTNIDFTGIPSWVKRITVMFQGVSTDGTSDYWLRLGTSGGFATSGYAGYLARQAASSNSYTAHSAAFVLTNGMLSTAQFSGNIILTNQTSNVWIVSGQITDTTGTGNMMNIAGHVSLSGTLTQVRLTSASSNNFDAGTINIFYE